MFSLGPLRPLRGSRFALRQPDACGAGECDRVAGEVVEVPVAVRAVRHPDDRGAERLAVRRGVVARQPERTGVDEVVEHPARLEERTQEGVVRPSCQRDGVVPAQAELAAEGVETGRLFVFLPRSERIRGIIPHVVFGVLCWLCNSKYTKNDAFCRGKYVSPSG